MAGQSLADWLNRAKAVHAPFELALEAYIRWWKAGHRGDGPDTVRPLFSRPFAGVVSKTTYGLDIMGRAHLDNVIWYVVVLTRSGKLARMRECRKCERWFFARYAKSKFCSPACRAAYFAVHNGKGRAALINRRWRIETLYLPHLRKRIPRLENLKRPIKTQTLRLEAARSRLHSLEKELREIKAKLDRLRRRATQ